MSKNVDVSHNLVSQNCHDTSIEIGLRVKTEDAVIDTFGGCKQAHNTDG